MTDDIDRLVARAADRPVDVGRLQSRVLSQVHRKDDLFGWLHGPALLVPAAFAAVLIVTPLAVSRALSGPDVMIAALAAGDPVLLGLADFGLGDF